MEINNYPTMIVVTIHIALHLFERFLYYLFVWLNRVSKSSCVGSFGKGCLEAEMEVQRELVKSEPEDELNKEKT